MEFVDSSGNVIDAIKSGLTFRVSCTTRGSAQVSDEIARGGMKDLNYDHGNGVTYYFRVPTNADSNSIDSINIIFPNEYDLSNDIDSLERMVYLKPLLVYLLQAKELH